MSLKGFLAGFIIPAIISPLFVAYFLYTNVDVVTQLPLLYFGSFFWGIWNVIYLKTRRSIAIGSMSEKIGYYGAFYGLISALVSAFYFEFTSVLPVSDLFLLLAYPVILFFVWMIGVNSLNLLFDNY